MALEQQNKKSTVIPHGCRDHWVNLLGEDLTPSAVIKHVVEVHKYFHNYHAPGSLLKEYNDHILPQLPGNTRWNSQMVCLETFVHNHSYT